MNRFKRVIVIVMDGCGAGSAPDAGSFGDEIRHDTLVNVARAAGGLEIPNLRRLGLGNLLSLEGGDPLPISELYGSYGRLREVSRGGKDTVTGHWEMMGIIVDKPFPTYPHGFPPEVIEQFCQQIGSRVLGNYPSSGTVIIDKLGAEHLQTGYPIVYTSADSVFQIAAHEEVVPVEKLYELCRIARDILKGEHAVQRVIARPFTGRPGGFYRTERRKDFPLAPPENVLDALQSAGVFVAGIGVIPEVFAGRGFTYAKRTQSNHEHYEALMELLKQEKSGFIFVNFEDFDMLYGHRKDFRGFASALETFDKYLGDVLSSLNDTDLLIVCSDHGNDPTTPGTDHSREYSPLLVYSPSVPGGTDLGTRDTYADVGATVMSALLGRVFKVGTSLLSSLECKPAVTGDSG